MPGFKVKSFGWEDDELVIRLTPVYPSDYDAVDPLMALDGAAIDLRFPIDIEADIICGRPTQILVDINQ